MFDAPLAAAALLAATAETQRLLLVVDQFEETFTVAHDQAALFQQALQRLAESRLLTLSGDATTDERPKTKDERSTTGVAIPSLFVLRPSSIRAAGRRCKAGWPSGARASRSEGGYPTRPPSGFAWATPTAGC